ncbi:MAG: hypothetical protein M3N91_17975 [Pseudomonadota bacterium]|nr:hypothetical protein [Pseudomonadota bacterium]
MSLPFLFFQNVDLPVNEFNGIQIRLVQSRSNLGQGISELLERLNAVEANQIGFAVAP